ncbi:hypothetical protein JHW06_003101 [Salmonella enterica subsp. enterica serovar Infantis]|uniref:Uncharacterized protein n=1 Tax=Salmonella enterica TaxID=28901 RepID=A0A744AWZ4_SALER|nr:hypothetical protein [Salmonella enterica subsp. enterica serovar Infantis]EEJ6510003.1 hypothetical protein [Salmonella enterica subsp. enterica]HAF2325077.1 hypothetical protein [Salmonella enterica]ECY4978126.1 hypothetical protein [Salmonella enterica subsp. enterica serovar Infantis]EDH9411128.1 hypothetical protein [Salmonella enterica subsp. enterica serovar Infantis]
MATTEKLTPLEELTIFRGEGIFIPLGEVCETIQNKYGMNRNQVAEWLYCKLCTQNHVELVREKAGSSPLNPMRELVPDDYGVKRLEQYLINYVNGSPLVMGCGFIRHDLEKVLGVKFPFQTASYQDDEYHHADNENLTPETNDNFISDINNDLSPPAVWENTHGMETANKLIAGLAIANAMNDKRCQRKDGLNKSAVARVAESALIKYGGFIGVTGRQLTGLISEALKYAPELKDDADSEQP